MAEDLNYVKPTVDKTGIIDIKNGRHPVIEYIESDMFGEPNELYGLVDGEKVLEILKGSD